MRSFRRDKNFTTRNISFFHKNIQISQSTLYNRKKKTFRSCDVIQHITHFSSFISSSYEQRPPPPPDVNFNFMEFEVQKKELTHHRIYLSTFFDIFIESRNPRMVKKTGREEQNEMLVVD